MSGLVGDVIMEVRRRIPDLPPILGPPTSVAAAAAGGGSLPAGTYYVVGTVLNPFGETLPTAEVSVTLTGLTGSNAIKATFTGTPLGATLLKVYVGLVASGEQTWFSGPVAAFGSAQTLTILSLPGTGGIPPIRPTAFLPDVDGRFLSAFGAFNLLKRACDEMVRIGGGIVDVTGIQAIAGQAMFRIGSPNKAPFFNFTNVWFDGYPMAIVPRRIMFLRNSVSGFTGVVSFEHDGDSPVVQCWPQPNRTGGTTTLSSAMQATDTTANVVDTSAFLSIGLMQIDSEIIGYSQAQATSFPTLIRGLAGTVPAAHAIDATVTELNLRFSGKRLAPTYNPGDSALPLRVPPAWEGALVLHMLSQVRSMEQDEQASDKLMQDFVAMADKITKASLGSTKPRQIQIGGATGLEVYNISGSTGWGWLIP